MKVLVTGGAGFMGARICRRLRARGAQVTAFQRGGHSGLEAEGVEIHRGDLREADAVRRATQGCQAVIHVAGKAGTWGPYREFHGINVTGTENVIAACRAAGARRLVFTSSPSVVHGGGDIEGADESLPYPDRFTAAYPETKALAEQAVAAANDNRLATVALRPHLVWGPGDPQLLPRLLARARRGPIRLPGADRLIDTVYVDNAVDAHLQALDALESTPACRGRAYFISNGEPRPQGEMMAALLEAGGVTARFEDISPTLASLAGAACELLWKATRRCSEPPVTRWSAEQLSTAHWYDISAARRDLGYEPRVSIEEGLRRLAAARSAV